MKGIESLVITHQRIVNSAPDYPKAEAVGSQRILTVGCTFQTRARGTSFVSTPLIRLCGKWLAKAGFQKGTGIDVTVSEGCIVITSRKAPPMGSQVQRELF